MCTCICMCMPMCPSVHVCTCVYTYVCVRVADLCNWNGSWGIFYRVAEGAEGSPRLWGAPLPRALLWLSLLTSLLKPKVTSIQPGLTCQVLTVGRPPWPQSVLALCGAPIPPGSCTSLKSPAHTAGSEPSCGCGSGASVWSWSPAVTLSLCSWAPLTTGAPTTVCVRAKCCVSINILSFNVPWGGDCPRKQSVEKPGALPRARSVAAQEQNLNPCLPKSGHLRQCTPKLLSAPCFPLDSPTQVDVLMAPVRNLWSF